MTAKREDVLKIERHHRAQKEAGSCEPSEPWSARVLGQFFPGATGNSSIPRDSYSYRSAIIGST
jgi:hypothetical protein